MTINMNAIDNQIRDLCAQILDSKEEHVDWLETQLELIGKIGEKNYLQSRMGG